MRAMPEHSAKEQSAVAGIKRTLSTVLIFAIFGLVIAGIIALRAATWLPSFHR